MAADARELVARLVLLGALVTWLAVALAAALLFDGLDRRVALLIGAILVVSGPTVVLPLLSFVRPAPRVRSLLTWEGVLVDPVGALLGVLVFHAAASGGRWQSGRDAGEHRGRPARRRRRGRAAALAAARGAAAGAAPGGPGDARDGRRRRSSRPICCATTPASSRPRRWACAAPTSAPSTTSLMLDFQQTLVQLLVGVLFMLIAASVSPDDVLDVLPEALALVAVMVLVIRPRR